MSPEQIAEIKEWAANRAIRIGEKYGFSPYISVDVKGYKSGIWFGSACNQPDEALKLPSCVARVYFRRLSPIEIVVEYVLLPDWIAAQE